MLYETIEGGANLNDLTVFCMEDSIRFTGMAIWNEKGSWNEDSKNKRERFSKWVSTILVIKMRMFS